MRILLARCTLYPGVEIKAEAAHLRGLQGVVGVKAARQHQLGFIEIGQQGPVECLTGAAALAADFRIQQQPIRRIVEGRQRFTTFFAERDSYRLPDLAASRQQRAQSLDIGGIFIPVQLHRGEAERLHRLDEGGGLGVAKYPDIGERRARHHGASGRNVYIARAFRHEDQATEYRTRLMGCGGILGAGEATHLVLAQYQLAHCGLQIRLGHQGRAHQKALGVVV